MIIGKSEDTEFMGITIKIALYFKKHMNNFTITNFKLCFLAIEKAKYFDLFRKCVQ